MSKTLKLVLVGLLVALGVVLTRFLSIETPIVRIGISFIAIAAAGILLGPVHAAFVGALIDIVGYALKPTGPYFPGFTISGALHGLSYGLLLHCRRPKLWRVLTTSTISAFIIGGFLTSLWLAVLQSGRAFAAVYQSILLTRVLPALVLFPVQIILIWAVWKSLEKLRFTAAVPK